MISGDEIKDEDDDDNEDNDNEKQNEENFENNNDEKDDIHDNIEINENVELEYEIKLPQFLIDYSEKTNKNESKFLIQLMGNVNEKDNLREKNEDFDENDLLLESEKKDMSDKRSKTKSINLSERVSNINNNSSNTPTPTPTPTPGGDNFTLISNSSREEQIDFNKYNEEEKLYKTKMNQYISLFKEGKINKLENLIDTCNKNSSSIEYKFNFTFDKYRYGNKQISYIVRCIDNKNDAGNEDEESEVDPNPRMAKYNKEKNEYIKPLFELLEEERKEILELPNEFLKLSLENKHFQKLLEKCKNDINAMSKAYGHKKDQILEDENSSQSSQAGYDSGLLKKNRIEEIRSNLLTNISKFYTLKYIKIIIYLICCFAIIFTIVYILFFVNLYNNLINSSNINLKLYQSTLWTTELISFFVTMRVLYQKEIVKKNNITESFDYYDFLTDRENISRFYDYCISKSLDLYTKISNSVGILEMEIPNYLNEKELDNIYWDKVNISYMNEKYKEYLNRTDEESFPMAIAQLLSNSLTYLKSSVFSSINDNTSFFNNFNNNKKHFDYMTYLIIENGYNNILPNQFNKLMKIPTILSNYNTNQINKMSYIIYIYLSLICILCMIFLFFFYVTNKSIVDGMDKVTKIKLEKIEEIIKKINLFSSNLKEFRGKDMKEEDDKFNDFDKLEDESINKLGSDLNNDKNKRKFSQDSSLLNNNGFNSDYKKYIPLNIMVYSIFTIVAIIIYEIACKIPMFILTKNLAQNFNQFLIVQNYILSNLIVSSTSLIEIKCFLSDCKIKEFNSTKINDYNIIKDVIRSFNLFPIVNDFYNEKYLLNACAAAFNKDLQSTEYNKCMNDSIITSANNTENLLKLTKDLIFDIKKDYEIEIHNNNSYNKKNLFNSKKYREIENIFFNYLMNVEDIFVIYALLDLVNFLYNELIIEIIILVLYALAAIIFCIITRLIILAKLMHYLTVSRFIMKIIPTSAIINTPELETWIENKY
jgi:hypothetical protein